MALYQASIIFNESALTDEDIYRVREVFAPFSRQSDKTDLNARCQLSLDRTELLCSANDPKVASFMTSSVLRNLPGKNAWERAPKLVS